MYRIYKTGQGWEVVAAEVAAQLPEKLPEILAEAKEYWNRFMSLFGKGGMHHEEAVPFVRAAYNRILGRRMPVDKSGRYKGSNYWIERLKKGYVTPSGMVQDFWNSKERKGYEAEGIISPGEEFNWPEDTRNKRRAAKRGEKPGDAEKIIRKAGLPTEIAGIPTIWLIIGGVVAWYIMRR